jgi:hypothetical protein
LLWFSLARSAFAFSLIGARSHAALLRGFVAAVEGRRTFREVVQIWRAGTGLMHSSSVET